MQPGILVKFDGVLRGLKKNQFFLEVAGEQNLTFRVTKKTQFYRGKEEKISASELEDGSAITVEATRELSGDLAAVHVWLNAPASDSGGSDGRTLKQRESK